MWSLSTNHQLETTDKKRTRSIARRVLRGENLVGLPAGADLPTLSGRRLTRPDCSSRARPATPRQFKSSYLPKGSLAEAGHHSAASQLTIEKLMWIMSSSFGMLVAFGLSVGCLLRAERHDPTSSIQPVVTIADSNRGFRAENPVCSPPHSTLQRLQCAFKTYLTRPAFFLRWKRLSCSRVSRLRFPLVRSDPALQHYPLLD